MTLLLTILAFGLMIFVHELGHFLVARAFGVGIERFSLGFGKPIAQFTRKGINYRIGWIPLGGYVKMKGENPDDPEPDVSLSFRAKAWWKKVLIGLSGPAANLVLGLLLFIISFLLPLKVEDQSPVLHGAEGKWSGVFQPGDSLISFNGEPVRGFGEFQEALLAGPGGELVLGRGGERLSFKIAPADADSLALSLLPRVSTIIGEVIPKTPAYHAKLLPGDRIAAVDSVSVSDWYAMRELILNAPRDTVLLALEREGRSFSKSLRLESSLATGAQKAIGIMQDQPVRYRRQFAFGEAIGLGAYNTANFVVMNYRLLLQLARKPSELGRSVGGPVMIASISQQIGRKGIGSLLLFFGGISLMLMIMNLLPIPILDGGLILFSVIEGIIRRPIPLRVQSILQSIGFVLLVGLMFLAFYSDVSSELVRFMNR